MYLLRRAWAELRNEVFVLPSRSLALAWVVLVLGLSLVYDDAYVLRILTMTCLLAMFAASWDMSRKLRNVRVFVAAAFIAAPFCA